MNETIINFNNQDYIAKYNKQTGYYEVDLEAPKIGGIYNVDINFIDIVGQTTQDTQPVQVWTKEKIKIETNKVFAWIFDKYDFTVKDIVELSDYEINIDEETNANTTLKVLKDTKANAKDFIAIKKNNEVVYWGIIDNIQNESGKELYQYTLKYITNMFNQTVELKNENLIRTTGIEDFLVQTITDNFINNKEDSFLNRSYLEVVVESHTKLQRSVDNIQNGIYNLHTWLTNCTQNYNIVYKISIVNKKLRITIKKEELSKELIDMYAHNITNYTEVFETNIVAKVKVLTKEEGSYTLVLLNDRTASENINHENRADGEIKIVYTEKKENARQTALDEFKQNSYNHMISFSMLNKYMPVGTPVAIKTKKSIILDTYISAIQITPKKIFNYTCGNMRVKFIDKLLKERK